MSGRVVHFEIPADKVDRAKKFYQQVFGWQISPIPEMDYIIVGTTPSDSNGMPKEPGAINGGMLKRQAPVKTPVITVEVDDIDASLEKIGALGGKVVRKKMAVGNMGFAAYFKDSEGNVMGLWQPARR